MLAKFAVTWLCAMESRALEKSKAKDLLVCSQQVRNRVGMGNEGGRARGPDGILTGERSV